MSEYGYADEILKIDLSDRKIEKLPTAYYADRFLGGRGVAAGIYWDTVAPGIGPYDPGNCLIFITGPAAGFQRLAGCRWQVCGKSPSMEPQSFSLSNLGGKWGAWLKYAGYDGLVVQGESDRPVYIYIHDREVEVRDASDLWGRTTIETSEILKAELGQKAAVLAIGNAGENLVSFSTMLADENATGSGGFASVMGAKKLKAIAAAGDKRPVAADPQRLRALSDRVVALRKDTWKNYLGDVPGRTHLRACYGCAGGCYRKSYKAEENRNFKYFCQSTDVYRRPALKYYNGWSEVPLLATRLCDKYGLDTALMQPMIEWLIQCYKEGVLTEKETGLPLSKIGSSEFIEVLTRKIAYREGFGDLLARGTLKAAEQVGKRAQELISYSVLTRASETKDYDPRLMLTNALLYATEPRRPIGQLHEITHAFILWLHWIRGEEDAFFTFDDFRTVAINFWGSEAAADFTTYEGKALAAKMIQDRTYAKESLILCDFLWPIIWVRFAEDHTGDPALESQVVTAITGRDMDEQELNRIGERVYNLNRALLLRDGWGGRQGDTLLDYLHNEPLQYVRFNRDCTAPDKNGNPVSRKGMKIERDDFEKLKSEFYELRGWNPGNGLPTKKKLQGLQLADVADGLERRGLLG